MNRTTTKKLGALTVLMAVGGGIVLLGTGASATVAGIQRLTSPAGGHTQLDVAGVTSLDLEVTGAAVTVEFRGDAQSARLQVEEGDSSGWSLSRDDEELIVRGPDAGFGWFGPGWLDSDQRVTLVLPERLEGIDADLTLLAGTLSADGVFGKLDLEVSAGSLQVTGEAAELDVQLSAGRADVDLVGVQSANYTVSAGRVTSQLHDVPREVSLEVSAGNLSLTLPDVAYDLRQEVNAGSLNSRLTQDPSSAHRITAEVAAGSVHLKPGNADN